MRLFMLLPLAVWLSPVATKDDTFAIKKNISPLLRGVASKTDWGVCMLDLEFLLILLCRILRAFVQEKHVQNKLYMSDKNILQEIP